MHSSSSSCAFLAHADKAVAGKKAAALINHHPSNHASSRCDVRRKCKRKAAVVLFVSKIIFLPLVYYKLFLPLPVAEQINVTKKLKIISHKYI